MGFKLRGGRKIPESKWIRNSDESHLSSISEDLHGGQVVQTAQKLVTGEWNAQVVHTGHRKWSEEIEKLSEETKKFSSADAALGWCRKRARSIIIRHDEHVTTKSHEYQILARRTTSGSLAPGSVEDFGASQRPNERFRTRRRRK